MDPSVHSANIVNAKQLLMTDHTGSISVIESYQEIDCFRRSGARKPGQIVTKLINLVVARAFSKVFRSPVHGGLTHVMHLV